MAEQTAPEQQPSPEATPSTQPQTGAKDYIERVRTDPDFAEKEVRNLKSRFDSTDSTLQKLNNSLGGARELIETGKIHGDTLLKNAQAWEQIISDEQMAQVIAHYAQTGQAPSLAGSTPGRGGNGSDAMDNGDDDFLTDTEKQLKRELEELKQSQKALMDRLGHTESSYSKTALQSHFTEVASEIGVTDSIFERVKSEVGDELDQLSQRAAKGDTGAQQTMQLLTGPNGRGQVERLFKSRLTRDDWVEIVKQDGLRKSKSLSALSTGGPGAGVEGENALDPKAFKGDWRAALDQARLHPERVTSQ